MKIRKKSRLSYIIFLVSITALSISAVLFLEHNPSAEINTNLHSPLATEIGGNSVKFVDRHGQTKAQFHEINGWLLLEAYLLKVVKAPISTQLQEAVNGWPQGQLAGWWPEGSRIQGKPYIKNLTPFLLPYDIDDSIWRFALDDLQPSTADVFRFLPIAKSPHRSSLCANWNCDEMLLLRTWALEDWKSDVDLVSISNAVSYIQSSDERIQKALLESKRIINNLIRQKIDHEHYSYYEPKSAGAALMLIYHWCRNSYLDPDTEKILYQRYLEDRQSLQQSTLISRWGGDRAPDEDWFMNLNFVYMNERIPKLLIEALDLCQRRHVKTNRH